MARVTRAQICTAIADTLRATAGVVRVQDGGTRPTMGSEDRALTESMPDMPGIQVYWQSSEQDANGVDRVTFGAGVRRSKLTYWADVFVRVRSQLGEDVPAVLEITEAVEAVLEAQRSSPFFALEGVKALHWGSERVAFESGGQGIVGVRFTIEVWVF